jgi:hypothetical protein
MADSLAVDLVDLLVDELVAVLVAVMVVQMADEKADEMALTLAVAMVASMGSKMARKLDHWKVAYLVLQREHLSVAWKAAWKAVSMADLSVYEMVVQLADVLVVLSADAMADD